MGESLTLGGDYLRELGHKRKTKATNPPPRANNTAVHTYTGKCTLYSAASVLHCREFLPPFDA